MVNIDCDNAFIYSGEYNDLPRARPFHSRCVYVVYFVRIAIIREQQRKAPSGLAYCLQNINYMFIRRSSESYANNAMFTLCALEH